MLPSHRLPRRPCWRHALCEQRMLDSARGLRRTLCCGGARSTPHRDTRCAKQAFIDTIEPLLRSGKLVGTMVFPYLILNV